MSYLKIFFRRKNLLFIPAIIGLALGITAGILMPKQYQSTAVLLVQEGKSDNPLFDKLAVATTVQERMSTIKESMLGWNSLVELVKRLKMDKNIANPQEYEELILGVRRKLAIKIRAQNIIDITYTGEEAVLTRDIVQNITDIFINKNVEIQNRETSDAINFIEHQLLLYKGKIKSAEIAKYKDELDGLLLDATEEHPRVKQLREQIRAKEEELAKENLQYAEDSALKQTETNNPLIQEIKKALSEMQGKTDSANAAANPASSDTEIYRMMLLNQLDSVLARDVDVNTKIYNMLLERLETAKITKSLQSSKEGTRYTVLDPARVPLRPSKPNRLLIAFAGLVLGLGSGLAFVFGTEFLDKSFIDVEEAKVFLGMPLVGAISKITTERDLRAKRVKEMFMYAITISGGIVIVLMALTIAPLIK
jgi:uncharacterized protein involved in exopolysaccharide biosynthesis